MSLAVEPHVLRIYCNGEPTGTGFLHRGVVITAAHVVDDCSVIGLGDASGRRTAVVKALRKRERDLALLIPSTLMHGGVDLATTQAGAGTQVHAWGFPSSYIGQAPLLVAGILSGFGPFRGTNGVHDEYYANLAANSGFSGSPLIDSSTGLVLGVVVQKYCPEPPDPLRVGVASLKETRLFGLGVDGAQRPVPVGQTIEQAIDYGQSLIQLGLAVVVPTSVLKEFLKEQGVAP